MHLYAMPFRETSVCFCVLFLNICIRDLDESTKCKTISTYLGTKQTWKYMLEKELWPNSQPACARVSLRSVDSIAREMA